MQHINIHKIWQISVSNDINKRHCEQHDCTECLLLPLGPEALGVTSVVLEYKHLNIQDSIPILCIIWPCKMERMALKWVGDYRR